MNHQSSIITNQLLTVNHQYFCTNISYRPSTIKHPSITDINQQVSSIIKAETPRLSEGILRGIDQDMMMRMGVRIRMGMIMGIAVVMGIKLRLDWVGLDEAGSLDWAGLDWARQGI